MTAANLERMDYDFKIKGLVDLEKMTRIYPIQGFQQDSFVALRVLPFQPGSRPARTLLLDFTTTCGTRRVCACVCAYRAM